MNMVQYHCILVFTHANYYLKPFEELKEFQTRKDYEFFNCMLWDSGKEDLNLKNLDQVVNFKT